MNIRVFNEYDLEALKDIHARFYASDFEVGELFRNTLALYTITNDDDKIITIGGVRAIAESVCVTDKDANPKDKREALYTLLRASIFLCGQSNHNQLHAFIQDEAWLKALMNPKVGFQPTSGKALVLCL